MSTVPVKQHTRRRTGKTARISMALGYGPDVKVGPYMRKRPGSLSNQEQQMILDALDITGKPVPVWLKPVFDAENRLLNRVDFSRGYDFTTERRQWQIAELPSGEQKLVYDEATKLPAYARKHLDIIVEKGVLV